MKVNWLKSNLSIFLGIVISVLIIFQSGHYFTNFSRFSNIFTIVLLLVLISTLYLINLNYGVIKQCFKNKKIPKPSFSFVIFIIVILLMVLSYLFNKNKSDNLPSYINYLLLFSVWTLFIKVFEFETFCKWYSNVLAAVCVVSIVFYILTLVYGGSFTNLSSPYGTHIYSNYYGLYSDYSIVEAKGVFYNSNYRLQGLFWEPGVFGTILLIGLLIEVGFKEKKNIFKIGLFLVSLVMTMSTGAFFVLPFILLYWLICFMEKKKASKTKKILTVVLSSVATLVAIVLVVLLFDDKFFTTNNDGSFFTRFYSSVYNIKVWFKSPIFGLGFKTAREVYNEITPAVITANTSTPFLLAASFGICGLFYTVLLIVGLAYNDRINSVKVVVLFVVFMLILHQENNAALLAPSLFYGYIGFNHICFKWEKNKELSLKRNLFYVKNFQISVGSIEKKKLKEEHSSLRPLHIILAIFVFSISLISINSVRLIEPKDEIYNISNILASKQVNRYDGTTLQLTGDIKVENWLDYEESIAERRNNKGLTFLIGQTKVDNIDVNFSDIEISDKIINYNSKSIRFIAFERADFSEDSIVIPKNLSDQVFGKKDDYSNIIGRTMNVRVNDATLCLRKVVGIYELNSNHNLYTNDLFLKNFGNVVFFSQSFVKTISSTTNYSYYLTMSGSYQSNYGIYYSSLGSGVTGVSYPELELNKDFINETSLSQYMDDTRSNNHISPFLHGVLITMFVISLAVFIVIVFNDFVITKNAKPILILSVILSFLSVITLLFVRTKIKINSLFDAPLISSLWIWICGIIFIVTICLFIYCYSNKVQDAILGRIKRNSNGENHESNRNILFVINGLGGGGSQRNVSILANNFINNGYTVHIAALLDPCKPFYKLHKQIRVHYLIEKNRGLISKRNWIKRLKEIRDEYSINTIVAIGYRFGFLCSFVSSKDVNLIVRGTITRKLSLKDKLIFPLVNRKIYAIVAQTKAQIEMYPKYIRKKICVISNPFQTFSSNQNLKGYSSKRILCIGRYFLEQKRQDFIIESCAEFLKNNKEYILELYGEPQIDDKGDTIPKLQNIIKNNGLDGRVIINQTDPKIWSKIDSAFAILCASTVEGMPNALIEGMMRGIVPISTFWNGSDEIIRNGKNGYLAKDYDKNYFSATLECLKKDKKIYKKISDKAYESNKLKYSEQSVIEKWNKLLG